MRVSIMAGPILTLSPTLAGSRRTLTGRERASFAPERWSPTDIIRRCWLRAFPLLGSLGARPALRQHTQSAFVEVKQSLLFVVLLFVHSSDLDDLAHDLRLEAAAFRLGVDFLDIFAERALLVFEPLDALDKRFELRACDTPDIGHDPPLLCCSRPPTAAGR